MAAVEDDRALWRHAGAVAHGGRRLCAWAGLQRVGLAAGGSWQGGTGAMLGSQSRKSCSSPIPCCTMSLPRLRQRTRRHWCAVPSCQIEPPLGRKDQTERPNRTTKQKDQPEKVNKAAKQDGSCCGVGAGRFGGGAVGGRAGRGWRALPQLGPAACPHARLQLLQPGMHPHSLQPAHILFPMATCPLWRHQTSFT